MVPGIDPTRLLSDFFKVAALAGVPIPQGTVTFEELPAPHAQPPRLPSGKMGVYVFALDGKCLKVGKAGPRSKARYTSQHYNPRSAQSNLARSILKAKEEMELTHLDDGTVGEWMKRNLDRVNFLIEERLGSPALTLLEVFLQCRLGPRFEG